MKPKYQCDVKFGTPVWHVESKLPEGVFDWALDIEKNVENQKRSSKLGYQSPQMYTSMVGGIQYPLNNWEEFPYLDHIKDNLSFFPKFNFLNYWVNINRKNAYNVKHTHPNSDLSVVWYITDSKGLLLFEDPLAHIRAKLCEKMNIPIDIRANISAGNFIIFPSDLPHFVEPHILDEPRITVAFNLSLV